MAASVSRSSVHCFELRKRDMSKDFGRPPQAEENQELVRQRLAETGVRLVRGKR